MANFFTKLWNDVTGQTQTKQMKDAAKYQQDSANAAAAAQLAWEKEQAGRLNKMQDSMWSIGERSHSQAAPMQQEWQAKYLDYLRGAPDTTYNAQRGQMERGFNDDTTAAAKMMRQRGMGNSGLFGSVMGNLQLRRAGMLSGLEGERNDRRGQMISQGTQYTQGLLDRALNQMNSAAGMPQLNQTMVPQMMMNSGNQAAQMQMMQANQPNPIANAASNLAQGWIMNRYGPKQQQQQSAGGMNPFYGYTAPNLAKTGLNAIMGANGIPFAF